MRRPLIILVVCLLAVFSACGISWRQTVRASISDPTMTLGGEAKDNLWSFNMGFCPDGFIIDGGQTQLSSQDLPYSVQLAGVSDGNGSNIAITSALPQQIAGAQHNSALQQNSVIGLFTAQQPLGKPIILNVERWDHGQSSTVEDDGDDADEISGATRDGDGVPNTDESSFDDSISNDPAVSGVGQCSVLPTTASGLTPAADGNLAPNGFGWNNSAVNVSLSATDNDVQAIDPTIGVQSVTYSASGADSVANTTVSGTSTSFTIPGADQGTTTVTYYATDSKGNNEVAKSAVVNIDTTPPTVSCPSPAPVFSLNAPSGQITAPVSDALSGIMPPSETSVSAPAATNAVGRQAVIMPTVSDAAGNNTSQSCAYNVQYVWTGFQPPVNNPPKPMNDFNLGQTVPVKFVLTDANGRNVQSGTAPNWLQPKAVPCTGSHAPSSSPSGTYTWNPTESQYSYTWSTKGLAAGCYAIYAGLDDGTVHSVTVRLS